MTGPFGAATPSGLLSLLWQSASSGTSLSAGGRDGEMPRRASAAQRSAEAGVREGETGLDAAGSPFFFSGMLDKELDDDHDEDKTNACA